MSEQNIPIKHEDPLTNWMKELGGLETLEPVKETDGAPDTANADPDVPVAKQEAATVPVVDKPTPDPVVKPSEDVHDDGQEEKWPRTSQEWKKFKEARKQAIEERESKIKTLQEEIETARKKITELPKSSPELESARKERDDLSDRLRTLDVERHPKFKAYFDGKTASHIELAKRIVGTEYADQTAKLLALPDGEFKNTQIEEMMLNLTPLQQSRFGGVLNALAETESERQTEIAKGRENYEKMVEEQKSVQQQRVQTIEKSFNEIVLKAQESKDGRVAYQKRDGDNEWNAAVEKRLEVARNLFFGKNVTTEQVISASLDAASLPAVLTEYDALHKENETLKAQIKALSKSSPSIGAGSSPETAQQQRPQLRVGMRPDEAISGWVKGLMADE